MSDDIKISDKTGVICEDEDEIDLLELAKTIWKGRKLILWITVGFTLGIMLLSLFMTDIYTAKAVLKPTSQTQGGGKISALASQFGGLASLAGIAMPSSASATEIVNLLESNILRKEIIENNQLLPVLFPAKWDEGKKAWKKPGISLNPLAWIAKLRSNKGSGVPDTWDGIRKLNNIVRINYNMKEDIITVSADFPDPEMAAKIVNYFVFTLNEHMSAEARRMAVVNKEYLEKQLLATNDSLVQQKIYNLIAEKIETMMMAEVKEGFAFKVLDPPMVPDEKSKPKRAMMAAVTLIVSLFLGVFIILFREYIKKIKAQPAGGHHAS